MGWMRFPKAGTYTIRVSCLEGDLKEASMKAIQLTTVFNNFQQ
jgi:hypothetical protein